jgi:hypothetical protein
MGAYALGYVDDVRDPMALLRNASGMSSFGGDGAVVPNLTR